MKPNDFYIGNLVQIREPANEREKGIFTVEDVLPSGVLLCGAGRLYQAGDLVHATPNDYLHRDAIMRPILSNQAEQHIQICYELHRLYRKKNADYGDSFHFSYQEEGMAMARIRLSDKLNRFKSLTRSGGDQQVKDESIRDTLIDLANYAIMTVMELDNTEGNADE